MPLFIEELTKSVVESGVLTDASGRTYRVPGSALPTWAAASIDDNNGCSKGLRSNSFTGSLAPSNTDLRADRTTS